MVKQFDDNKDNYNTNQVVGGNLSVAGTTNTQYTNTSYAQTMIIPNNTQSQTWQTTTCIITI